MKQISQSEIRRVQIFGISLTEMMLILLFLMFLVAKNAVENKKGALSLSAICNSQLEACKTDLNNTKSTLAAQNKELEKLKQWVASLMASLGMKPLSPGDPDFIKDVERQFASRSAGFGKPTCLGPNSYLVELIMEDGFIGAEKRWATKDDVEVSSIPALTALVGSGRIPFPRFLDFASSISGSKPDCLFNVAISDRTTRKDTYKPQLLAIERYFRRRVLN